MCPHNNLKNQDPTTAHIERERLWWVSPKAQAAVPSTTACGGVYARKPGGTWPATAGTAALPTLAGETISRRPPGLLAPPTVAFLPLAHKLVVAVFVLGHTIIWALAHVRLMLPLN